MFEIGDTIKVLYEDNHLLVLNKPSGLLVQADATGDPDLLSLGKAYIKKKYNKPGNVFLGLIHRIDRPVSGIVVLARTSKAASRLSEQIREREVEKIYLALAQGCIPVEGAWADHIGRKGPHALIDPKGKPACLNYTRLSCKNNISKVRITLETGRHHQIRVQFAHRGFPLLGDFRYGSKVFFPERSIALHAASFRCTHPTQKNDLFFSCEPNVTWDSFI